MRQINLFLAIVWLALSAGFWFFPELVPIGLRAFHVQLAVFAVAMCCYNVSRWYLTRLRARYREEAEESRHRPRHRQQPIDPTFDLSDDEPGGTPQDQ